MSQPQQIAQDVYAVDAIGIPHAISVLLVREEDGWTLVDTGIASSAKRIREALETLGSGPESLKRIVLTHQHDDHVGGLQNVLQWAPRAEISASAHESEVISGRRGMDPQSNGVLRRSRLACRSVTSCKKERPSPASASSLPPVTRPVTSRCCGKRITYCSQPTLSAACRSSSAWECAERSAWTRRKRSAPPKSSSKKASITSTSPTANPYSPKMAIRRRAYARRYPTATTKAHPASTTCKT